MADPYPGREEITERLVALFRRGLADGFADPFVGEDAPDPTDEECVDKHGMRAYRAGWAAAGRVLTAEEYAERRRKEGE